MKEAVKSGNLSVTGAAVRMLLVWHGCIMSSVAINRKENPASRSYMEKEEAMREVKTCSFRIAEAFDNKKSLL